METFEAYCVKCRKKVQAEQTGIRSLQVRGGTRYQRVGKCSFCGREVYRFVSKDNLTSEERKQLGVE